MQRVVSINLSGNAYQVEENGYNALFAYLDATEAQLKDSPDRAQALADLERVVADKCQACLGPHKNVVTSAEVDRLLLELGPIPGQPAADARRPNSAPNATSDSTSSSSSTSASSSSSSSTSSSTGSTHRRLYQIREGSMIGGVCMGLSEFLHIDVTIIRILFVIFAFVTNGFGMIAYGALMFILPKVQTRAEASGGTASPSHHWPWDDGWPWEKHGWPWDNHGWPWDQPRGAQPAPGGQPSPGAQPPPPADWRAERRAARAAYRSSSPFGTFGMVISLMLAFFWLSFWTRGHFFFGWPFFWGFPHWIGIVIFFMVMRTIFMPFRMARWHRYGYGYGPYGPYGPADPYAHPHHAWVSMWNGLAWFGVMIFAVWAAYHYIPEVGDFMRNMHASWTDSGFHV